MAAGEGTRMRSDTPKLLHELCGRPMIAWTVAAAQEAGAERVVVVEGPGRELEEVLDGRVEFAIQEQPNGTAGAVRAATPQLDGARTVVVLNGDHPLITSETIRALAETHERSGAAATIATAVLEDPTGYGRIVRAPDGTIERVAETKADGDASALELHIREINTGFYAFDIPELVSALERVQSNNAQGELYLPDVLPILRADERTVQAYELSDPGSMHGVNDRVGLALVRAIAQQRIHERLMREGSTIVNPAATVIDFDVQVGRDSVIAPFTSLHGRTRVGTGSTIGPGSTLIDATVGDGSSVIHSYIKGAEIADEVTVGPFAYLRPGTVLRDRSKAGTFVEIKNSDVGAGTKVPHLSYIGDADIGEGTNLGAATITANYDGYRKHRTTIGAGVKTSVDTTLVAPVTLGDEAYTAAGSVITKDVPPGGLGVARPRQQNIEGYADRRKEREGRSPDDAQRSQQEESRQPTDLNSERG
jgi:bifunctional UDP-N-acetylglucosamine pyrophosphorylase/glucosamine-1-phosphate N-acetyltransferase